MQSTTTALHTRRGDFLGSPRPFRDVRGWFAHFDRGLRAFFEYRDLGIEAATQRRVAAHAIRAAAGTEFASQPHLHRTELQLVYVLKGWIEFEYAGQGRVRLEAV